MYVFGCEMQVLPGECGTQSFYQSKKTDGGLLSVLYQYINQDQENTENVIFMILSI